MDPYSVLGVNPNASDEEIKKTYRDMVKKYHPDKYKDSDLKDLADEKIKSINKAYDDIVRMRKNGGASSGSTNSNYNYSYNNYSQAGSANFVRIRTMIQMRRLTEAERELDAMSNHNAEWHYLKGVIALQRGWADGAKEHFKKATDMAPGNMEYRHAYNAMFAQNTRYKNYYGNSGMGMSACDLCTCAICSDCCCECMGGDLIGCC
jgi:molecular chaperone DnaJ